jgi:hypothetical protein
MWSLPDIADALEAGLRAETARLDVEQAVTGLDGREELELHPMLAAALTGAGFGVHREQRYPADRGKRSESEGERCDLVLTPDGRGLAKPEAEETLFEDLEEVPLDEAFWLEVKVVAQYQLEGPNQTYSSQLLSTVREDVTKLAKDRGILHAGLLIVLFVQHKEIAEHDLGVWQDECLKRTLPITAPYVRGVPITDRLGNTHCALALYGVAHY